MDAARLAMTPQSPIAHATASVGRCHTANSSFPANVWQRFTVNATATESANTLHIAVFTAWILSSGFITHCFIDFNMLSSLF